MALDSHGKAHVAFGRIFVSDDNYNEVYNLIYPYTDGLIYWNESMPLLDTAQLADWNGLIANGNLIASMIDYSGNDTIDFPEVGSSHILLVCTISH